MWDVQVSQYQHQHPVPGLSLVTTTAAAAALFLSALIFTVDIPCGFADKFVRQHITNVLYKSKVCHGNLGSTTFGKKIKERKENKIKGAWLA